MIDVPNSTNVNSSAISAVVSPYSRKQSHNSTSSAEIVKPGGEGGNEAAAVDRFRGGVCGEGQPQRIDRFVIAPHAAALPHHLERLDTPSEADDDAGAWAEQQDVERQAAPVGRR